MFSSIKLKGINLFYTVYKITNTINNKIYIGIHKTNDLNDNYMGSGTLLKDAYNKYGIEYFKKEYIAIFDNKDEMYKMESDLVNQDFINSTLTYNIKLGGYGGFDYINNNITLEQRQEIGKLGRNALVHKLATDKDYAENFSRNRSMAVKELWSQGIFNNRNYIAFTGKTHSDESKLKIGLANSIHQTGIGNSQYNTVWVYSIEYKENKKVNKDSLQYYTNNGWIKGRKMKFD